MPALQLSHSVLPSCSTKVPTTQESHIELPVPVAMVPTLHAKQDVAPWSLWKKPFAQGSHDKDPALSEYVPKAQREHFGLLAESVARKVPVWQGLQTPVPSSFEWPAGHWSHEVAPVEPNKVPTPSGHTVHCVWTRPAVLFGFCVPETQAVHSKMSFWVPARQPNRASQAGNGICSSTSADSEGSTQRSTRVPSGSGKICQAAVSRPLFWLLRLKRTSPHIVSSFIWPTPLRSSSRCSVNVIVFKFGET
mmetsp:Transcript_167095/g.536623  ORF Transcript_167095/g.536623 Transcript_167095/m.536623 type:complete len:249 (-) Transcript_167095:1304-2050(-)